MKKRKNIIYWVSTGWLALGMTSTGLVQILQVEQEVERTVNHLGFPIYFLSILGIWKLLGVVAVLVPRFPVLKEWAYAGFFFTVTGALIAHGAIHDPMSEYFPAILLLTLTLLSWYFRPENRRPINSPST